MVYGTYNYSIHGVYKPSFTSLGGPHIVNINQFSSMDSRNDVFPISEENSNHLKQSHESPFITITLW